MSRSWTTRQPRPAETDADYKFVTRAQFEEGIANNVFLEWAEYVGNLYGTPVPDPESPTDILLVIEVQGAAQVLRLVPDAVMIFMEFPSRDVQEARLRSRGDTPEQIAPRLAIAATEEARGRELAHHVVVNDDLDRAVAEVASILAGHRKTV